MFAVPRIPSVPKSFRVMASPKEKRRAHSSIILYRWLFESNDNFFNLN
jgi:hypothetical protein